MIKKRKPSLPGEILYELHIKPLGMNKTSFADAIGISRNTLHNILSGKARITVYIAARLAKALNTSIELWLNLQQKIDIWEVENDRSFKSESASIRPLVSIAAHTRY